MSPCASCMCTGTSRQTATVLLALYTSHSSRIERRTSRTSRVPRRSDAAMPFVVTFTTDSLVCELHNEVFLVLGTVFRSWCGWGRIDRALLAFRKGNAFGFDWNDVRVRTEGSSYPIQEKIV